MDVAVPADHRVTLKESEMRIEKLENIKLMLIPIVIGALGTVTKGLIKGLGGLGNNRMSRDNPNYCIIEIGQNTEKSHRNLRRLTVTQTSVKDNQLMLMRKTLKE